VDGSLVGVLGLGLLLGVTHALDADHVAAVSTLVSRERRLGRSCLLGVAWGLGHTAALLVAGIGVIAFKLAISPRLEHGLEMAVAVVLILLGGHVLVQSLREVGLHRHAHTHDGRTHHHLHLHLKHDPGHDAGHAGGTHDHVHLLGLGRRPFLVGLLHGLAGSAALMLLVLSTISSPAAGLLYIVVFGVGSTAGMLLLSGLIGLPFALAGRSPVLQVGLQLMAGAVSLGLGAWLLLGGAAA
jgi:ABC-type nickel/cobalt efflux system permease component RcnA